MSKKRPSCETCPYWNDLRQRKTRYGQGGGECRRPAPALVQAGRSNRTTADYWCGEHPRFATYVGDVLAEQDEARDRVAPK